MTLHQNLVRRLGSRIVRGSKLQAPSSREAPSPNAKEPSAAPNGSVQAILSQVMGFGSWCFSGAWVLVLGALFTGCQHTEPQYSDLPAITTPVTAGAANGTPA